MTIFKQFTFDSAHFLPNVPDGHKCKNIHGHTYRLTVYITGELHSQQQWVMDFSDVKETINTVLIEIDHKILNGIEGLGNPTCENVTLWLWNKIKPRIPKLIKIELWETSTSGTVYNGTL